MPPGMVTSSLILQATHPEECYAQSTLGSKTTYPRQTLRSYDLPARPCTDPSLSRSTLTAWPACSTPAVCSCPKVPLNCPESVSFFVNGREKFTPQRAIVGGFPGGSAVKNPPCNAGDVGSIPGQELRSHAPQLSLHIATTKSVHLNYRVCTLEPMGHN